VSRIALAFWPRWYRALGILDPVIAALWRRFGIGNVVRLVVPGRRSGIRRAIFLGLLRVDGRTYLGHPNPACDWTRNVDAAGGGELQFRNGRAETFRAVPLQPGPEQDAVVRAAIRQHPFPAPLLYWLARHHICAVGRYYRLVDRTPAA
jgi:hypothetical protein